MSLLNLNTTKLQVASVLAIALACSLLLSSISHAIEALDPSGFHHISFKKIPETVYERAGDGLTAQVKKSSSFLFRPYDKPLEIKTVRCVWRAKGPNPIPTLSPESRQSKEGDDFPVRIGLMLAGKAPLIPFFAASWIKAVEKFSKHSSDRMLYLTAGSGHLGGTTWTNPYSSSIENLAFTDTDSTDGWVQSEVVLPAPKNVVGLWIMSDGDNTGAEFTVTLKDLDLK